MTDVHELRKCRAAIQIYRAIGLMFLFLGGGFAAALFVMRTEGNPGEILHDPLTVLFLILPFLPAACTTFILSRYEKRYQRLLDKGGKRSGN